MERSEPGCSPGPLSSSTGDAIEFVGTRDYREGDPPRNIHWRSWARRGAPVVKEYQEEYFCRIALILDTFLPARETDADRGGLRGRDLGARLGGGLLLQERLRRRHPAGRARRVRGERGTQPRLSRQHPDGLGTHLREADAAHPPSLHQLGDGADGVLEGHRGVQARGAVDVHVVEAQADQGVGQEVLERRGPGVDTEPARVILAGAWMLVFSSALITYSSGFNLRPFQRRGTDRGCVQPSRRDRDSEGRSRSDDAGDGSHPR